MKVDGHRIDLKHRDKVFFPDAGLTKGDLVRYYDSVAGIMVRHLKRYPVSMHRFPDGIDSEGFFNKDTPTHFPDWIRRVRFPRREGGAFEAPVIDSRAGLVYLADQGVVTPHLYLSRSDDLEHPDRMIYDLDPPEETEDYGAVRAAALQLRDVLGEIDLACWIQTTGSKGFHVVVPLDRSESFDRVRAFARDVALVLVRRHEDRYTLRQRKDRRKGRIFLDVLRNAYGATSVAPYAVRARPGAPVATPIDWSEVERGASPRDWTLENLPMRLGQKDDPWTGFMRHARSLDRPRERLRRRLEAEKPANEEKD